MFKWVSQAVGFVKEQRQEWALRRMDARCPIKIERGYRTYDEKTRLKLILTALEDVTIYHILVEFNYRDAIVLHEGELSLKTGQVCESECELTYAERPDCIPVKAIVRAHRPHRIGSTNYTFERLANDTWSL